MPSRFERMFRALAYGLAAILLVQVVLLAVRRNPLAGLEVPSLPQWNPETNTPPAETASKASPRTTNTLAGATNMAAATNIASVTNTTNATNTTHSIAQTNLAGDTNLLGATNLVTGTNSIAATNLPPATNQVAGTNAPGGTPSAAAAPPMAVAQPPIPFRPPFGGPGPRGMRPSSPLPPVTQARIDRITSSEMLAPVFRPPPMALLGIAGHHAFIRTPNGQSALLREGGESDGIKLLRLGTNRVLIEQAGEKKELTIFDGFRGPSLLTP
ncbi:MAG: hypothetical protein KIT22_04865 [Verrucomicrobiae bacterium]|nr:hypothetical protein [Verrucomicrobiae bacterium]